MWVVVVKDRGVERVVDPFGSVESSWLCCSNSEVVKTASYRASSSIDKKRRSVWISLNAANWLLDYERKFKVARGATAQLLTLCAPLLLWPKVWFVGCR